MNRYQNTPIRKDSDIKKGIRYYTNVFYPEIPLTSDDIYVITVQGDRLDLLAQQYYGDSTLYWVISTANNHLNHNSLFIPEGTQLRIPANYAQAVTSYTLFNQL